MVGIAALSEELLLQYTHRSLPGSSRRARSSSSPSNRPESPEVYGEAEGEAPRISLSGGKAANGMCGGRAGDEGQLARRSIRRGGWPG